MLENTSTLVPETAAESVHYLDTYAKVSNVLKNSELEKNKLRGLLAKYLDSSGKDKMASRLRNCGQNWVPFSDTAGHVMYTQITCGLPFCPTCGKPGSALNQKRSNRVKDVLLGFPCIGHFVFTLPKEVSNRLPESGQINQLYKLAWVILKDWLNAEAAIIVLHFCGDKKNGLHLHFDCSFPILHTNGDCSYPLGLLNAARAAWTAGVNQVFETTYLDIVGHYNFVATLEQENHLIKYITRSTVGAEKFVELPDAQKEYCIKQGRKKIIRYYGEFVGKKKAAFLAKYKVNIEKAPGSLIDQRICPICNEKMRAGPQVFMDDIPLTQVEHYNSHTLVDRQIMAWLRQKERERPKPPRDLLEAFQIQEMQDIIDQSLDQDCEEIFSEARFL